MIHAFCCFDSKKIERESLITFFFRFFFAFAVFLFLKYKI